MKSRRFIVVFLTPFALRPEPDLQGGGLVFEHGAEHVHASLAGREDGPAGSPVAASINGVPAAATLTRRLASIRRSLGSATGAGRSET